MKIEQVLPRGLRCRDGAWYIDKIINGVRIYRSLKTSNLEIAMERFHKEIDLAKDIDADAHWKKYVNGILEDQGSWLHDTLKRIKRRENSSKKGCTLLPADMAVMLLRSNGKCEVTGIPFSDEVPNGSRISPFKESIDRIDSSKGYHAGNCRVVCLAVNLAMRDWGESVMITIGKAMLLQELQREIKSTRR